MFPPGSTIGILGGGQLGRMTAVAARRMGYRVVVLDPTPGCPAAQVADEHIVGRFDDLEAAARLAEACRAVGDQPAFRRQAEAALRLDNATPHSDKKLPADLRDRLQQGLRTAS